MLRIVRVRVEHFSCGFAALFLNREWMCMSLVAGIKNEDYMYYTLMAVKYINIQHVGSAYNS